MAHAYCCKWRLKANVSKSAVVVLARELVNKPDHSCMYGYGPGPAYASIRSAFMLELRREV